MSTTIDTTVDHVATIARNTRLEILRSLMASAEQIREELDLHEPNEILESFNLPEALIIVTSDGLGGAAVRQYAGNFPTDYTVEHERLYTTEELALRFAAGVAEGAWNWSQEDRFSYLIDHYLP